MRWAEANHPFAIWPGICRVHRAVVLKRRGLARGGGGGGGPRRARSCARATSPTARRPTPRSATSAAASASWTEAEEAFAKSQEIRGGPCGGLALLRLAQGRVDAAMVDHHGLRGRRGHAAGARRAAPDARPRRRRRSTISTLPTRPWPSSRTIVDDLRHADPSSRRAVDHAAGCSSPRGDARRRRHAPAGRGRLAVRSTSPTRRPPRGRSSARRSATPATTRRRRVVRRRRRAVRPDRRPARRPARATTTRSRRSRRPHRTGGRGAPADRGRPHQQRDRRPSCT